MRVASTARGALPRAPITRFNAVLTRSTVNQAARCESCHRVNIVPERENESQGRDVGARVNYDATQTVSKHLVNCAPSLLAVGLARKPSSRVERHKHGRAFTSKAPLVKLQRCAERNPAIHKLQVVGR
jgi:hypothetical protein